MSAHTTQLTEYHDYHTHLQIWLEDGRIEYLMTVKFTNGYVMIRFLRLTTLRSKYRSPSEDQK